MRFSDGLSDRKPVWASAGEYWNHTCGECVRCTPNFRGEPGYHCSNCGMTDPITPDRKACEIFWDKAAQDEADRQHEAEIEQRRKLLWAVYAEKPPVKLRFEDDYGGTIPMCPVCGEMPYSTKQCYWCGQRYVQDSEVEAYCDPGPEIRLDCPSCGGHETLVGRRAKYNGHLHGQCEKCGAVVAE